MTENNSTSGGPETSNGSAPTSSSLPANAVTITTPSQPQQEWPADPTMYQLTGKIGQGAFATVWKAYRLIPSTTSEISASTTTSTTPVPVATTTSNDTVENSTTQDSQPFSTNSNNTTSAVATTMVTCAVKVLNLDQADSSNLAEIRLEVQAMRLLSHPNVLACHTAFVNERNLWLITPLMAKGSSLHSLQSIRKFVRRQRRPPPQFADDPTIHPSTTTLTMTIHMEQHIMYILHETIVGLQYIHENLQIHRDIKAGNILIDTDGTIKIADFGVSSFLLLQNGSLYQHEKAKTFVGTPCWMAPEVMEQINGYDYKADIWSLGITALELAKGYAPYAKYPPMKVLILTIQEEPPSLASYNVETGFTSTDDEYDDPTGGGSNMSIIETYSSDFEDFVRLCLRKDPSHRPTCTELLASRHFSDYTETRQRRMDTMRDEICALVKDVGSKQEERASVTAMANQQPTTVVAPPTTYGANGIEDATVMAGNIPKSAIIQQRVAEVEDRPAGTTWIFATEESLSDTLATGTGTQRATNDNTVHLTQLDGGADMTLQGTVRRRGSGQQLGLDGEYDDVLAELDEFERQTGGEHYDRQRQLQQQEEEISPPMLDTISVPYESATVDASNGSSARSDTAGNATGDDLDQFMDEFEQNTGGEDFRRASS